MKQSLCIALLAALCGSSYGVGKGNFYAIAHGVNVPSALDFAVQVGTNAIEIDIQYNVTTGDLIEFRHGGMCDCKCNLDNELCNNMRDYAKSINFPDVCELATPWQQHMEHIANKSEIQLVYFDSKITPDFSKEALVKAATNLVDSIVKHMFSNKNFVGDVLISSASPEKYIFYTTAAAEAAHQLPPELKKRIFFTFDATKARKALEVAPRLHSVSKNVIYSNGLTSCFTFNYRKALEGAMEGMKQGFLLNAIVWTVDKPERFAWVYRMGARGVLTNNIKTLVDWARSQNLTFAKAGDGTLAQANMDQELPAGVTADNVEALSGCECTYYRPNKHGVGGCVITRLPPAGKACKCEYKGMWTCSSSVVPCTNASSELCKTPEPGMETCLLGGGDCEGYPTCDCDYHSGGCSISVTAPVGYACECRYRGLWTCGGTAKRCDLNQAKCTQPDKTKEACVLGGGDCGGY
eukprot:comp19232_c0_seq1/m.22001 comp19232_c0_seq1/g.22001  ORF comp19232_c0_seq1/g.22001 comp19232_c0_seq1/m.22001 type:complete len:465 (-) comp19232_c0_seq1:721-2115(-)